MHGTASFQMLFVNFDRPYGAQVWGCECCDAQDSIGTILSVHKYETLKIIIGMIIMSSTGNFF